MHTARTEQPRFLQYTGQARRLHGIVQLARASRRQPARPHSPVVAGHRAATGVDRTAEWMIDGKRVALWEKVGYSGGRMVMQRGTRVAGLLPPSHPGSEFGHSNENP